MNITLADVHLHYSSLAFKNRSLLAALRGLLGTIPANELQNVHALKGISLDIGPGERVGIIGPNGSGKSTLLKTVAGLYPIQSGKLATNGNIRHILDLMLGFEPEATGRENIFYRGLLLGEKPEKIHRRTDEIIEFADIGKFIDYPVKTYSSGMAVRLAFSISTALPGEILLVDEVIGAGDAEFMEKAKKRFLRMIEGTNILMIASHDHHTLAEFCTRGIVMKQGKIDFDGPFPQARNHYMNATS